MTKRNPFQVDINYELEIECQPSKEIRAIYGATLERALRDLEDADWYVRYRVAEWFLGETPACNENSFFSFSQVFEGLNFRPSHRDMIRGHISKHLAIIRKEKIEYDKLRSRQQEEADAEKKRVADEFNIVRILGVKK